jgi:hypothetical protein
METFIAAVAFAGLEAGELCGVFRCYYLYRQGV